ncbi:hypothetical protein AB0F68_08520 [Micromonospora sp. NPDC023966]|uniref:hypothetical protein n=1 Tax=Micromonospora sp. NPDC023966 TaxID=3154699 RepID=UPI00340CBBBD
MEPLLWYVAYGSNPHAARLDRYPRSGLPMLTFTAPHRASEVDWASPAPVYLGMLARGLREAHGWDVARATGYLADRPGVAGRWSRSRVRRLVVEAAER